jgi:hypothetical protein
MTSRQALLDRQGSATTGTDQLLVTWQDPDTGRYHAVGLLSRSAGAGYRFRYLDSASTLPRFSPFLGFSGLQRDYASPHLFPLFAERVLDEARPDRRTLYQALDLGAGAGPMEFLARSGGRRAGDRIELLPTPDIAGSHTSCLFLVHGVRHIDGASDAVGRLHQGQQLALQPEPDNPTDPDAVLVTDDGTRLGWVPNPLLDYVRAVMSTGDARLTVVRANSPEFGHHMRLLVRIEGTLPEGFVLTWHEDDMTPAPLAR